ncbi:septum formation family protein [Schaalia vaccimaxillae]|uniref:septum formation family protein n=1 Tax=Schaalia vaccimaxillae TaxID=183916 RepID=UPI000413944B|nr:septum formation family protein [Schaalia vaccimaxillae]
MLRRSPHALVRGACIALLVTVVLGAAACSDSSARSLKVGDCLQMPTANSVTVEKRSCSELHQAEVSLVHEVEGDTFPGEGTLDRQAETVCIDSFEDYVGSPYISSALEVTWTRPTVESWEQGDRTIACLVHVMNGGDLDRSAKNSQQ